MDSKQFPNTELAFNVGIKIDTVGFSICILYYNLENEKFIQREAQ